MLRAFDDGCDTVIAESEEDAVSVWVEVTGDVYDLEYMDGFSEVPSEQDYTLTQEKGEYFQGAPPDAIILREDDDTVTHIAKMESWINVRGRCFLGSLAH